MTRYEHIEGIKHLRIRVFYDKGGMNYLTSHLADRDEEEDKDPRDWTDTIIQYGR
jgi:hypothetical protein